MQHSATFSVLLPRHHPSDILQYETLRIQTALPNTSRICLEGSRNLHLRKREIAVPAHTYVSVNFHSVHLDQRYWGTESSNGVRNNGSSSTRAVARSTWLILRAELGTSLGVLVPGCVQARNSAR